MRHLAYPFCIPHDGKKGTLSQMHVVPPLIICLHGYILPIPYIASPIQLAVRAQRTSCEAHCMLPLLAS